MVIQQADEQKLTLIDEDGMEFTVMLEGGKDPTAVLFDPKGTMVGAFHVDDIQEIVTKLTEMKTEGINWEGDEDEIE